jgi:protein tyrosine phosphatase (PTP) superfamily phosphohydrolase (DUF442 family)
MRVTLRPLVGVFLFLTILPLTEILRVTAGPNFHEIIPGCLYRSAQLTAPELRAAQERFGIRSVINLRGCCPDEPWYHVEAKVCRELGIEHYDLNFSAYLPPAPQELQKLLAALQNGPRPLLIHCRRGADRTGLASAIAYLFQTQGDSQGAWSQISLRQGHLGWGRVQAMRWVLERYFAWLPQAGSKHSQETLQRWATTAYRPGPCWAVIEPLTLPETLALDQPIVVRFRAENRSHQAWQFRKGANVGVHLRGFIEPDGAKPPPGSPKFTPPLERRRLAAGFFDRTVPPGESIELEVPIPALRTPGGYRIYLDLFDEASSCYAAMVGSTPFDRIMETTRGSVAKD